MVTLVTGGSGSGKSAYAEERVLSYGAGKRIYLATMMSFDEESRKRIERHRRMRQDKEFQTLECYRDLQSVEVESGSVVLLECMSNLVANEMYAPGGAGENVVQAVQKGLRHLMERADHLVIVTNEIFSDCRQYDPGTVLYQKNLGKINCVLGEWADEVVEVVYGIPVFSKKIGERNEEKE